MSGKSHPRRQAILPPEPKTPPPALAEMAWTIWCLRGIPRWSQAELAARSGVPESSISRFENGKRLPSPKNLAKICAAVGVPSAMVDAVLRPAIRKVLAALSGTASETSANVSFEGKDLPGELMDMLSAIVRPTVETVVEEVLRGVGGPWRLDRPPSPADRLEAQGLWAVLRDSSAQERELLLEEAPEYWSWAVCELACAESVATASHSAERALKLAEVAVEVAQRVLGSLSQRAQGYAGIHLGNAKRVHGHLQDAEEAFRSALPLWKAGAPVDPGLFNEARVLGLEATLRIEQRQPARALDLLAEAMQVDRHGEKKYLLVNRARALELLGDYHGAITALRQAEPLIDGEQEPRLLFGLRFNLLSNLLHLGSFAEAEEPLRAVRVLANRLGRDLDLVRTRWLEGWLAAGLGRRAEAIAALEEVCESFNTREIPFDAALATLELATLYLEEERTREVWMAASRLKWIFQAEGIEREALAALRLFYEAAEKEAATVELTRRMASFLYRAQHDPELRFEG